MNLVAKSVTQRIAVGSAPPIVSMSGDALMKAVRVATHAEVGLAYRDVMSLGRRGIMESGSARCS